MDVGRAHRGHLAALDLAHPAFRVEHEDVDPIAPGNRVNCRRAGVARSCADDRQPLIPLRQEFLEQQAEQLQRHVLERQRRAVEQLQQPLALVELDEWRYGLMREAAVGFPAQLEQAFAREAVADERLHYARGKLSIGQAGHRGDFGLGKPRPFARDVEPAIGSQAGERRAFEIERRGASSGRDVIHRGAAVATRRLPRKQAGV